jgi:hypothetical protein
MVIRRKGRRKERREGKERRGHGLYQAGALSIQINTDCDRMTVRD